jgi:enolase-phosphatase E1
MTPLAIVTDIEGTTSSIAFVHQVLFPYARDRLADFVMAHCEELGEELAQVRAVAGQPNLDLSGCIAQLIAWLDADRKMTPLKAIQGMIWADGYADGSLVSDVYPDAVESLRHWHAQGIALYVYSSGSIAAQKLLFAHSNQGDVTPLFSGHFDTTIGGKKESGSYSAIARQIGVAPQAILFLSDTQAELAAAREAGFRVILIARDAEPVDSPYPVARDFGGIISIGAPA